VLAAADDLGDAIPHILLRSMRPACYIPPMGKATSKASTAAVRESERKPAVLPTGYGSLRGQIELRPGIDLTKPIYEQYLKLERRERRRKKR
jgi:hypothetical protein